MSIRDRGYQGYHGPRLEPRKSWRTIFRHSLAQALGQPWVTAALILAALWVVGWAVIEYLALRVLDVLPAEGATAGSLKGMPELNAFPCFILVRWYGIPLFTLVIALAGLSGAVADDRAQGALHFYFARPISSRIYLIGKGLAGLVVVGLVPLGAALATVLVRLSRVGEGQSPWLLGSALSLRAVILVGLVTVAHAVPALALSTLSVRRGIAQSALAVVYFLPSMLGATLAAVVRSPWPELLSLHAQLQSLGLALFAQLPEPGQRLLPWQAALVAFIGCQGLFLALLYRRLDSFARGQVS